MTVHRHRKALAAAAGVVVDKGASQINRQEPHRAPEGRGKAEGLQGVAFLHRESRPDHRPNRNQKPN